MSSPLPAPPILSYATPSPISRRGKGFLAVCATIFIPGLGHLLAGFPRRALFWMCLSFILAFLAFFSAAYPLLVPAALLLMPLCVLAQLLLYIDAYRTTRRSHRRMLPRPIIRYGAGVLIFLLAYVASPVFILVALERRYLIETFATPTNGMSPAIIPGDRFFCSKIAPYHRWSVVVFIAPVPGKPTFVERIIGLPGETVEIVPGQILINSKPIPIPPGFGPYLGSDPTGRPLAGGTGHPLTLGPDEYYLLGDNSPISGDARYWPAVPGHPPGALPSSMILGPITAIYWPPKRIRRFD